MTRDDHLRQPAYQGPMSAEDLHRGIRLDRVAVLTARRLEGAILRAVRAGGYTAARAVWSEWYPTDWRTEWEILDLLSVITRPDHFSEGWPAK